VTQDDSAVDSRRRSRYWRRPFFTAAIAAMVGLGLVIPAGTAPASSIPQTAAAGRAAVAATDCSVALSGAAVPTKSSGVAAVRTTIGVAKSMGVPVKGQIIAVMVMFQESSLRNLANDGTTTHPSWPAPGRDYWLSVTRLSLKYPHDLFGARDGAHDTDSIGLYQQRPAYGWGNYGDSTGTTDPEGVVQRLLDPRWEAMAFFGGSRTAAPKGGLLDVAGWQTMAPTVAADAVQQSNHPDFYAQWEIRATDLVNNNQDVLPINLPWVPGGGRGALSCTSIPTDPARGEAGRNPFGSLDSATIQGTGIRVSGWAFDPDAINGLGQIHFYDQGPFGTAAYGNGLANQPRDDVNRAFNVVGKFGFVTILPWTGPGLHTICAYAINVGRGVNNPQIGCLAVGIPGPIGSVDGASRNSANQIDVRGWAADPASPGAREEVHIYVTGPSGTSGTSGTFTGDSRPDVGRVLGWPGSTQGFHRTVPSMGYGNNQVCVFAINVKPPITDPVIGCRTVYIPYPPGGTLDSITVNGSTAQVAGWVYDPNSPNVSIPVHIYVLPSPPGQGYQYVGNDPRADVNAVMGIAGRHGFARSVTLGSGANTICVFAIGVAEGNNSLIQCRVVQSGASPRALAVPEVPQNNARAATPADTAGPQPTGGETTTTMAPATTDQATTDQATTDQATTTTAPSVPTAASAPEPAPPSSSADVNPLVTTS
jgi:hypothetical protein